MRYFFRRSIPPFSRVLLVESGSREILSRLIPVLQTMAEEEMELDLVTCYTGTPEGFQGRVFRVADYAGPEERQRLYTELAARHYTLAGVVCSGEPIMTKWKWMLAARLRSKIFIVNENADFFWFDWGHWRIILQLAFYRAGMSGASVIPTLARLVFFPFTLIYLLLFAGAAHLRRRIRTSGG